eukprot:gene26562-32608_t
MRLVFQLAVVCSTLVEVSDVQLMIEHWQNAGKVGKTRVDGCWDTGKMPAKWAKRGWMVAGALDPLGVLNKRALYLQNGAGGCFHTSSTSNQAIAQAACQSIYGTCYTGSCGCFYYYYGAGHYSCNCGKAAGQYEFIYSNTCYTTVGNDYGGASTSVAGDSLF